MSTKKPDDTGQHYQHVNILGNLDFLIRFSFVFFGPLKSLIKNL